MIGGVSAERAVSDARELGPVIGGHDIRLRWLSSRMLVIFLFIYLFWLGMAFDY